MPLLLMLTIVPSATRYPLHITISKVYLFSEKLYVMQAHIIILSIDFLFYHLIWFMAYWRWNLEIRISRNLLQNPKEGHYEALKDLKDTEIETLWFGFWLKKAKLSSCYQPYLSYYLLIFLIYQNILLWRGHFYCTRLDSFCYNTQNGLNMRNLGLF